MQMKSIGRRIWQKVKIGIIIFILFTVSGVFYYRFFPVLFTPLMLQRACEQVISGQNIKLNHNWVPIESISPNVIQAAVAAEDNNFLFHFGIDFKAIKKAQMYNQRGKRIRGASTISQQTCKNVYLWLGRNYLRKGLEVYYTLLVEIFWSKERIMEVYLNSIEMGNGIYGIEAASRKYFHKSAYKLTRSEAALIVAAFPNPRKRNPAAPSTYLKNRQQLILSIMNKIGPVKFN
jgi:monofunctional biosynthetic peptidoglycan transglycosylase